MSRSKGSHQMCWWPRPSVIIFQSCRECHPGGASIELQGMRLALSSAMYSYCTRSSQEPHVPCSTRNCTPRNNGVDLRWNLEVRNRWLSS
ncbi:hypothetical protein Mapa_006464 [Marchantia paleacea]|nr:hypothetical protein Mapa_006464 [Marchantia paleacea]